MVWKGSGNHTRKMSAAAQAASASVTRKWIAGRHELFTPDDHAIRLLQSSNRTRAAQALVLLRTRLAVQAPLFRGARGFGGMALLRRDQRAPDQVAAGALRPRAGSAPGCGRSRATISSSPASVTRWPASARSRAFTSSRSVALRSSAKRSCTAEATLLTFWPPGPAERMNATSRSASGISRPGLTTSLIVRPSAAGPETRVPAEPGARRAAARGS